MFCRENGEETKGLSGGVGRLGAEYMTGQSNKEVRGGGGGGRGAGERRTGK